MLQKLLREITKTEQQKEKLESTISTAQNNLNLTEEKLKKLYSLKKQYDKFEENTNEFLSDGK